MRHGRRRGGRRTVSWGRPASPGASGTRTARATSGGGRRSRSGRGARRPRARSPRRRREEAALPLLLFCVATRRVANVGWTVGGFELVWKNGVGTRWRRFLNRRSVVRRVGEARRAQQQQTYAANLRLPPSIILPVIQLIARIYNSTYILSSK